MHTPKRLREIVATYGLLAVALHTVVFALVLAGFVVAIRAGFDADGAAAGAGTIAGAYVATQLTQPVRIAATLALTPLVARALERLRRKA